MHRHGWFALAAVAAAAAAWMSFGQDSPYALIPALAAGVLACVGVVVRDRRVGTVVTALYGLGCALYLFRQKLDTEGGKAVCSIDSYLDCGKINDSEYSMVMGIPIALVGAAYYAGLAVAALRSPSDPHAAGPFQQLNALLGLVGVAYAVFLAWASAQVGAMCVVCVTMYAVNGLLLVTGLLGARAGGRGLLEDPGALLATVEARAVAGVGVAVVVGGMVLFPVPERGAPPTAVSGKPNWSALYAAAGELELTGNEPSTGSRDARYEVVEFADFGCPHCARAKKELDELVGLRRDVSVRFKPFALSGACNPTLEDHGVGQERCDAARAAVCAHRQDRFWPMAELLFANQGYFEVPQLRQMAEQAAVDLPAWDACMQDPSSLAEVAAEGAAGGKLGIRGTPAIYVRGFFGSRWVEITRGVPAVLELIEAVEAGEALPAP